MEGVFPHFVEILAGHDFVSLAIGSFIAAKICLLCRQTKDVEDAGFEEFTCYPVRVVNIAVVPSIAGNLSMYSARRSLWRSLTHWLPDTCFFR